MGHRRERGTKLRIGAGSKTRGVGSETRGAGSKTWEIALMGHHKIDVLLSLTLALAGSLYSSG